MENNILQEYISALVDERKAGLKGCECMYLHFLVRKDPLLHCQYKRFLAVKVMLSTRKVLTSCPQNLVQRIHEDIRRMYLERIHAVN